MHILGSFDIINSNDKKFLAVFSLIIVILIALLMVFTFNSFSNNNDGINYYVDDIGGYNFSIPDFLIFESENVNNNSEGKIYSGSQISLSIIVIYNNTSTRELLDFYKMTNYSKIKIDNLDVYKSTSYTSTDYLFNINNDTIQISFLGEKNTDILVEEMLRNI
ncbi:hypothetical protein [Methanobrevibacter sp.]|uniref:hypothetical protein n=1 Tax=Methanobrevibacter sp. TaxID=66852 RepID=UPI00262BD8ED|nr:hypothetical protein [uncultured Methanobrevibacter sp.]